MSRRRQRGDDSTVKVDLSEGASFTISFKGNVLNLTHEEHELITSVSSIVQSHKDRAELTNGSKE
jgi:hypothetical protein